MSAGWLSAILAWASAQEEAFRQPCRNEIGMLCAGPGAETRGCLKRNLGVLTGECKAALLGRPVSAPAATGFTPGPALEGAGGEIAPASRYPWLCRDGSGSGSSPDISVTVTCRYFGIVGSTVQEAAGNLRRAGLLNRSRPDHLAAAQTAYSVRWSYKTSRGEGRCSVSSARVLVDLTYSYPELVPNGPLSKDIEGRWRALLEALKRHEEGHGQIALDYSAQILRAIKGHPAASNCGDLRKAVDEAGHRLFDECQRKQRAYDESTQSGFTQGTKFP